ncbi:hypothetical protein OG455_07040 [Kitasatospora sp. NBC_01287]|uniref:hypothetical protein n=1 Tax=Kitasatospora sp. NBC_01287 TaxID=2903573 RepID=UPI0022585ABB|nr:hypothetical protein [Kitasatospora sp. NBC_01287]MCX4745280.1 hypothetical protein [Kitasatospora sp. NBC_01287]
MMTHRSWTLATRLRGAAVVLGAVAVLASGTVAAVAAPAPVEHGTTVVTGAVTTNDWNSSTSDRCVSCVHVTAEQ